MSLMLDQLIYQLKYPYHLVKTGLLEGFPAELRYKYPQKQLKIIAITGTDGKTTSSTLLYHVLKTAGKKVGLISTVAAYLGNQELDTGFHVTAPQPNQVYKLMRQMVDQGYEYLVLEATSHGIYQSRTWGIHPIIAGVTNVNHEHFDYHLNYDNYVTAKGLLLKSSQVAVINAEDQSAPKLRKMINKYKTELLEYEPSASLPKAITQATQERFPESYNKANVWLVTMIAHRLQIDDKLIAKAVKTCPPIPGRMEEIANPLGLKIVVDFAHTPQGLEAALTSLKKTMRSRQRLIAVFGAAGLRDQSKRPLMTQVATQLADLVVLTAEDPRTENVWSIIRQMKEQLTLGHDKIASIPDRRQAIAFGLAQAQKGDVVGVFGKGHEKSMAFGSTEFPWSDQAVIKELVTQIKPAGTKSISTSDKVNKSN